jgi:hypothetical protein
MGLVYSLSEGESECLKNCNGEISCNILNCRTKNSRWEENVKMDLGERVFITREFIIIIIIIIIITTS